MKVTNLRDGKRLSVMHGECFIKPIDRVTIKDGAESREFIIGHSESGHNHMLISDKPFKVWDESAKHDLFVQLFEPAKVSHKKSFDIHEDQVLAPGDYAVYHKAEYDPFADVMRAVYD